MSETAINIVTAYRATGEVWREISPSDTVTFAGFFVPTPNPHRRWWQFWRPRMVRTNELQRFTVMNSSGRTDP